MKIELKLMSASELQRIKLNVFHINTNVICCYEKVGFTRADQRMAILGME